MERQSLECAINSMDLMLAAESLDNRDYSGSLWYLDRMLGKDAPGYATLDDVAGVAEKVVDRFAGDASYGPALMCMADALYTQQKNAMALEVLREELTVMEGNMGLPANFTHHLWVAFNYSLDKTGSIKDTETELGDFYDHEEFYASEIGGHKDVMVNYGRMVREAFRIIDANLPTGDSPLMQRIEAARHK
jgi:hypothetical protein